VLHLDIDTEEKEHFKSVLREGNIDIARMVIQEMVKEKEAPYGDVAFRFKSLATLNGLTANLSDCVV